MKENNENSDKNLNRDSSKLIQTFNLSKATHPAVCMLHIGFKAGSIFCYLFFRVITMSSVHTFISVVLFCAVDFWYVKNVSGRLLVGLR